MKTFIMSALFSFSLPAATSIATFAGGCFWCTESVFDGQTGVISAVSGYTDGAQSSASYKLVSSGKTKHFEAVKITYDTKKISYKELLELFLRSINPTDSGGQFADRGTQYKAAIFFHDKKQEQLAKQALELLEKSNIFDLKITVPVLPFKSFYSAEESHQDYHLKNSARYKSYYYASGRGSFLKNIWKKRAHFKLFK